MYFSCYNILGFSPQSFATSMGRDIVPSRLMRSAHDTFNYLSLCLFAQHVGGWETDFKAFRGCIGYGCALVLQRTFIFLFIYLFIYLLNPFPLIHFQ